MSEQFLADIGIEGDAAAPRFDHVDCMLRDLPGAGNGKGRAHDMQVAGTCDQRLARLIEADLGSSGFGDVENEVARAVVAITHESTASGIVATYRNCRDVGAIGAQPLDIDPPEIIVADRSDDAGRAAHPGALINEDRWRPARIGTSQRDRLEEAIAAVGRHDLDQDLADSDRRPKSVGRKCRAVSR